MDLEQGLGSEAADDAFICRESLSGDEGDSAVVIEEQAVLLLHLLRRLSLDSRLDPGSDGECEKSYRRDCGVGVIAVLVLHRVPRPFYANSHPSGLTARNKEISIKGRSLQQQQSPGPHDTLPGGDDDFRRVVPLRASIPPATSAAAA